MLGHGILTEGVRISTIDLLVLSSLDKQLLGSMTTLGRTTFSIMTLSINLLFVTFSITTLHNNTLALN